MKRAGSTNLLPFIPSDVARRLGYYVYLYIDPVTGKNLYVGKGKGDRVLSHLEATTPLGRHIRRLRKRGLEPKIDILVHGLKSEETALRIEAALIDLIGKDKLLNQVRGWQSMDVGRAPLTELVSYYGARRVKITHPALLIRINQYYYPDIPALELYEATRGIWKAGPRREGARYAFAVYDGVVREVYEIRKWHPAGSTRYQTRKDVRSPGRWEFTGTVAPERIRQRYLNRDVRTYFSTQSQNPITYVNC